MCRCYQAYVLHKGAIARKSTVLTRRFNLIQLFFLKLSSRRMCQAYREEQPNLKASWEKVPDPTKENAFSCVDLCIHYFSYWKILHQRVCDMNWSLSCMKSEKLNLFVARFNSPLFLRLKKTHPVVLEAGYPWSCMGRFTWKCGMRYAVHGVADARIWVVRADLRHVTCVSIEIMCIYMRKQVANPTVS